jgi:hypothetical protein
MVTPVPQLTGGGSRRDRVEDLIGAARYVCPPEWSSSTERARAAAALRSYADGDLALVDRACARARRRLSTGSLARSVVQLLEGAAIRSADRRGHEGAGR